MSSEADERRRRRRRGGMEREKGSQCVWSVCNAFGYVVARGAEDDLVIKFMTNIYYAFENDLCTSGSSPFPLARAVSASPGTEEVVAIES